MKVTKQNLVIKSNKLIGMQSDLNLTQLKLFAMVIIATVKNPQNDFYRFSIKELMDEFNITDTNYTALKRATGDMIKLIVLKTKDREHQLTLFTDIIYESGVVDMYLHKSIKPYILDIEKKYTKYYFENISWLNSIYSIRIYELLKEYEFRKSRNFELWDLRFLLNISEDKYKNYPDFKKRVLLSSQRELQEKTDLAFTFEEIRERRRVVRLDFKIISQQKGTLEVSNTLENSLSTDLKSKLYLNDTQIKTVLKQFDEEYIKRNMTYTLHQKNIKNLAGYFMKALELDYGQAYVIQQDQKAKVEEKAKNHQIQLQKEEQEKAQQEKVKKEKIQDFIDSREEEVKELIPKFIKANSFILQNTGIDLENTEEILTIIKGEKKELNHIKSLFMGFIAKVVLGSQK